MRWPATATLNRMGLHHCVRNFRVYCNLDSNESDIAMGTGRTGRGFAVEEGIHAARWQAATADNNVSSWHSRQDCVLRFFVP